MKITELHPPTNGGVLWVGEAASTRGRRYKFMADAKGGVNSIQRHEPIYSAQIGSGEFWSLRIPVPPSLRTAVRSAMRTALTAAA